MTDTPGRKVISGVEVDVRYSTGGLPCWPPAGAVITAMVPLTDRARNSDHMQVAIVQMCRVDPDSGEPLEWWVGLPDLGWVDDITWPTVDAAVTAVRNPATVKQLRQYARLALDSAAAARRARDAGREADEFRAGLLERLGATVKSLA